MNITEIIEELNAHGQDKVAERMKALDTVQQEKLASQVAKTRK